MFIRTAGERDLASASALLSETWHAAYDAIYGAQPVAEFTNARHSTEQLRKLLLRPYSEFVVADTGTGLAGIAHAAMGDADRQLVELHELAVLPSMQGRGVGGLLLDEIESSFFECRLMRVEVDERNSRAVAFYQAAGFATVGRKPSGQWVDAVMLTLEKPLG